MKKLIALLLALTMVASLFVGCSNNTEESTAATKAPSESTAAPTEDDNTPVDISNMTYDEASSALYNEALGEFYTLYEEGKEELSNLSLRFALMAQAEAKLLASGTFLPLSTKGGNYAISCAAPYGYGNTLWGNDMERFHNMLVADKFITAADRAEMKAKFAELKGTGTYQEWSKNFLTEKGYTLVDSYTIGYPSDPQTWDVLATSRSADSEAIVNTYDGLYEYDVEGTQQPALAESVEVSEDGTVYTFKIREGVKWVDSQGREVADVKADDFVAGMQHALDSMGGLEYLVQGVIVGADEYINGDTTDFADVGVKALDDYTLQYTLCDVCPYFMTMLGYGIFAPMSRAFYESMGGKFGEEYDAEDPSYKYGKDTDSIAYCGPYRVTNATAENTIVFAENESYWNKDNITVKTLTWLFNDGTDATKAYNDVKNGVLSGAGLSAAALEAAKADGLFDEYAYVSETDATSYCAFMNLNRQAYANFNDSTVAVSTMTEEDGTRTNAAMRNLHFRRALVMSLDRASYNAQTQGEDLKLNSLRNTYTPGNFVSLSEDVTIDINGTETTFPAGTFYGEIVQAQLDADGMPITVWDAANLTSDSFDGWYNPTAAAEELAKAVEELAAQGVEVSAENPIYLDLPTYAGSEVYLNRANSFKQSVAEALGGAVVINLVECADAQDWYNAGYYTDKGSDANYNIYDVSGWGPDYGDPQTYLDTMLPDYAGYMTKCLGIF